MISNNIKQLRLKWRLTQRQLAELVGTSQQQVQRIEAGTQAATLALAHGLATALQCTVADMFPDVGRLPQMREPISPKDVSRLSNAGLELDPMGHTLIMQMEGRRGYSFPVSPAENDRVRDILLGDDQSGFLVFDTLFERVAIRLSTIASCHFLFDAPSIAIARATPTTPSGGFHVWLRDGDEPHFFDCDADDLIEDELAALGELGELEGIFFDLGAFGDELGTIQLDDVDGEEVILFTSHIAMCSVPLEYVCPSLLDAQNDGLDEDEYGLEDDDDDVAPDNPDDLN